MALTQRPAVVGFTAALFPLLRLLGLPLEALNLAVELFDLARQLFPSLPERLQFTLKVFLL